MAKFARSRIHKRIYATKPNLDSFFEAKNPMNDTKIIAIPV